MKVLASSYCILCCPVGLLSLRGLLFSEEEMERGWIWARGKVCEGNQEEWREGKLVGKDCKREESFFNNKKK